MSLNYSFNELNETFDEENDYDFRAGDSIIFLVDGTKQMHTNDYFEQCIETYRNIVRQKCSHNRKDKMGLIIFGTTETNCNIDNVMTLQKFDSITIDSLKNIQSILKDDINKYKQLASDSNNPIYEALAYAFDIARANKINPKARNIIVLCTCNDNPCSDAPLERRRIEYLVATFKDAQTELRVIGLSDSWDDEIYYKDLQIISGTFKNDDYKRIYLKDFEQTTINPARSICKLPWKISSDISVEVSLINLISAPKYLKIKMEKDDNEILEARQVFREENLEESESENLREARKEKKIITDDNVIYYKHFCGLDIKFKPSEYKQIKHVYIEPEIGILVFKPIMCDPLYHSNSPYFVTYTSNCSHENKIFFMAFISRCAEKKVMPICKVVTKSTILICMMIPSEDDGGFYMYKIPFCDSVRDLDGRLDSFIFSSEHKPEVNNEAVDVFKQLMELSKIKFDPKMFRNPKLEKSMAHLEALALDEKLTAPTDDDGPPPITNDMRNLSRKLMELLDLQETAASSRKRPNSQTGGEIRSKYSKYDIGNMAQRRRLTSLTVVDLKEFLASVNLSIKGNKSNMIDRINQYFNMN